MQDDLLDRVRKLLSKAEDEGCPPAEAEALTAKAAELMARYGIDRALLGALRPETDSVGDRVFDLGNPWAAVKAHLLAGLAIALRCQCVAFFAHVRELVLHTGVFGAQLFELQLERVVSLMMAFADFDQPADIL